MVAAGIEDGVGEEGGEKLRKAHRAPQHDDHKGKKALQDIDVLVGPREFHAHQNDENGDKKGGQAEATGNEIVGDNRSD